MGGRWCLLPIDGLCLLYPTHSYSSRPPTKPSRQSRPCSALRIVRKKWLRRGGCFPGELPPVRVACFTTCGFALLPFLGGFFNFVWFVSYVHVLYLSHPTIENKHDQPNRPHRFEEGINTSFHASCRFYKTRFMFCNNNDVRLLLL